MATLINLLPDLRQEKLRNQQRRRLGKLVAGGVIGACIAVVAVLFLITLGQSVRISQLSNQIREDQSKISSVANLQKILTVQQHLDSLSTLYTQRVYLTRFYSLISTLEPKDVSLKTLTIDQQNNLAINGSARNFGVITKFVKALEASNLSIGFAAKESNQPYFSNLKLASVAADNTNQVTFSVTATISSEVTHGAK